jgi:hypothetical protein
VLGSIDHYGLIFGFCREIPSFLTTTFQLVKLDEDAGYHQARGQGTGMAIGAQIARPGRQVLTLMGDGGFGISSMDKESEASQFRYAFQILSALFIADLHNLAKPRAASPKMKIWHFAIKFFRVNRSQAHSLLR